MLKKKDIKKFISKRRDKQINEKPDITRNYVSFFGLKLTKEYWICVFGLILAVLSYYLYDSNPDNVMLGQLHIKVRNSFLYFWGIYFIMKFVLVRLPISDSIRVILDEGIKNKHYGYAILSIAILFGLIVSGYAAVLVASV
jgi:uncharacterized membrane protein YhaH (DUF805 family)